MKYGMSSKDEEIERQRREQGESYEETIKKLTALLHKGDISEESYRIAVRSLEDKSTKEERVSFSTAHVDRAKYESTRTPVSYHKIYRVSDAWFLVPLFLGIIGGLIAYLVNKDDDRHKASDFLIFGILVTGAEFVVLILWAIGLVT